ncbi:hypothetical protein [Legionella sainthelensi]|uniref:Uncharacterized protein n=1 Tax=Legionella sainthelensi TaxID=28087 RepID=A0A2H5FI55_9GAMM|nr:hypothetical protein [Legionella sainthelensi]AUH71209.1 hypothetical protein CAB17_03385 [Legionella sainthelensi]
MTRFLRVAYYELVIFQPLLRIGENGMVSPEVTQNLQAQDSKPLVEKIKGMAPIVNFFLDSV